MNSQAITFDFHNTLAHCPEWFDLEVRTLPSAFLRWRSSELGAAASAGTLEDADRRYRQLRQEIMAHGNELTAEESLVTVFDAMRLSIPEREIAPGVAALMREALAGVSPVPGAVETVRSLHETGVTIGVVSSAVYHPFLEWSLEQFGIRSAMSSIITSASAGFYKSRPEIYLLAAESLGAAPSQMVHVGDSLRFDVGGARRAGMGTVWLQHEPPHESDPDPVPDLTLTTLRGSAPRIRGLLDSRPGISNDRHDGR